MNHLERVLKFIDEADEELEVNIPDPEAHSDGPMTPVQRARLALHWAAEDLKAYLRVTT